MAAASKIRWEDLKIEKEVPMPSLNHSPSSMAILGKMEVNESFAVPKKFRPNVVNAVHRYRLKIDKSKRFETRITDTDEIRCWRTK